MFYLERMQYLRKLIGLVCILGLCTMVSCARQSENMGYHHNPPFEKRAVKKEGMPIVVIDPGHGGYEGGAPTSSCDEKDLCLRMGLLVRRHLESKGYHVVMTRIRDEHVPLKKRAEIANKTKSHVLVSLHFNAAKSKSAQGIEVFYSAKSEPWRSKKSKQLAQKVLSKLIAHTGAESRGIKEGNLCVIRETHMPSILVEGGFMTNDEELKKLLDERYLDKLALGVVEGLDCYFQD